MMSKENCRQTRVPEVANEEQPLPTKDRKSNKCIDILGYPVKQYRTTTKS
jgi:hypothetical protein